MLIFYDINLLIHAIKRYVIKLEIKDRNIIFFEKHRKVNIKEEALRLIIESNAVQMIVRTKQII